MTELRSHGNHPLTAAAALQEAHAILESAANPAMAGKDEFLSAEDEATLQRRVEEDLVLIMGSLIPAIRYGKGCRTSESGVHPIADMAGALAAIREVRLHLEIFSDKTARSSEAHLRKLLDSGDSPPPPKSKPRFKNPVIQPPLSTR